MVHSGFRACSGDVEEDEDLEPRGTSDRAFFDCGGPLSAGDEGKDILVKALTVCKAVDALNGRGGRDAPIFLLLPVSAPDLAYRIGPLFAVISLYD